jgi:FMN phosphatase YigB (HAD superfamily)
MLEDGTESVIASRRSTSIKNIWLRTQVQSMTPNSIVFLVDVDDTLLDNDRIQNDPRNHLQRKFGRGSRDRYWAMQEEMSHEAGYRDYRRALQRYRSENPTDVRILSMSSFLADYPFANPLFPGALDVFERFRSWGQTVILSDGDLVFQPRRVERSGICEVVEGHVFIYVHKEEALEDVWKRYAARHYVLVDDKHRNLTAVKKGWGDSVTAVFPRQGKFAHDRAVIAANPTPDVTVERASDLLGFELLALLATSQFTKNRNPNLPRHEVTT